MKVKCPKCRTEREIVGTEERVRCANKEDCGKRYYVKDNIVPEKPEKRDNKGTIGTTKPKLFNHNGSLESLVIMANYAINTIKNKKEVKEQDLNSTWYQHYLSWTKWRRTFQIALEEK